MAEPSPNRSVKGNPGGGTCPRRDTNRMEMGNGNFSGGIQRVKDLADPREHLQTINVVLSPLLNLYKPVICIVNSEQT